jgi:hypothetical protein
MTGTRKTKTKNPVEDLTEKTREEHQKSLPVFYDLIYFFIFF